MNIIETERLLIRQIKFDDVMVLENIFTNPEVMKYSFRGVCTRVDIENYIKECLSNYKNHGFGQWAVIEKMSLKLLGVCGLNPGFDGDQNIIHLASRFAQEYWGKGLASEALCAIMEYAKNKLDLSMVYALIEPANVKSIKLILTNGFDFQKKTVYKGRDLTYYKKLL